MNWLQNQIQTRIAAFKEYNGLTEAAPGELHDEHLQHIYDGAAELAAWVPPERIVLPMLDGDIEQAAAGMAALNGEDFTQMTEDERQPYRESAADAVLTARKKAELDRQARSENERETP